MQVSAAGARPLSATGGSNNNSRSRDHALHSPASGTKKLETKFLQLFKKLASRAGNINSAWHAPLTVFHALDDASRLAAFRAIRALARVHHLLTIRCFSDLSADFHSSLLLISSICAQRPAAFSSLDI